MKQSQRTQGNSKDCSLEGVRKNYRENFPSETRIAFKYEIFPESSHTSTNIWIYFARILFEFFGGTPFRGNCRLRDGRTKPISSKKNHHEWTIKTQRSFVLVRRRKQEELWPWRAFITGNQKKKKKKNTRTVYFQ